MEEKELDLIDQTKSEIPINDRANELKDLRKEKKLENTIER